MEHECPEQLGSKSTCTYYPWRIVSGSTVGRACAFVDNLQKPDVWELGLSRELAHHTRHLGMNFLAVALDTARP